MQGLTEEGIVVEEDVRIGTYAVICDGVTVGAHSVVGAGAVVTRADQPGARPTVRAHGDAVEVARRDRRSGMWGPPDDTWGWLMPVNGFYRLSRGTYAQSGELLADPEAVIDTVAAHARDHGWFSERDRNACNVLDVVHPLWLCARQSDHRRAELRDRVAELVEVTTRHWADGAGFGFATADEPGLQGTEMWLSIMWLAADLLGESDGLPWHPRGVHRPEPADSLHVEL